MLHPNKRRPRPVQPFVPFNVATLLLTHTFGIPPANGRPRTPSGFLRPLITDPPSDGFAVANKAETPAEGPAATAVPVA